MVQVFCAVVIVILAVIVFVLTMHFTVGKSSKIRVNSMYIVNFFKYGNNSPTVTELVDFDRSHKFTRYIVD